MTIKKDKPITEAQQYAMLSIRQWYDTERHKIEKEHHADLRLLQKEFYHRMSGIFDLTLEDKKCIDRMVDGTG